MYKLNLKIDGKAETFKRTDEPFLKDITRALILNQHQIKMYGKEGGPTDKDYNNNTDEIAKFAVDFWNGQFSKEDVINGANAEAMTVISSAIDECLGTEDPDKGGDNEAKKSPETPSKNQ